MLETSRLRSHCYAGSFPSMWVSGIDVDDCVPYLTTSRAEAMTFRSPEEAERFKGGVPALGDYDVVIEIASDA